MYIHAGEVVRVAEFDLNNSHCGPLHFRKKREWSVSVFQVDPENVPIKISIS